LFEGYNKPGVRK